MANKGEKDTNSSQFYISIGNADWLDDVHVVFGEVVKGMTVLEKMMKAGTKSGEPRKEVRIADCGVVQPIVMNRQWLRPSIMKPRN